MWWHKSIAQYKASPGPMLGFKSLDAAQRTLAGIDLMHMLKKNR